MNLSEIKISSYRSIVNQRIIINNNCICFIGPNESGKSNLLNAIRFLDTSYSADIKDKSKINDELPKVHFIFNLTDDESKEVNKHITDHINTLTILPEDQLIKHFKIINYSVTKYMAKEKDTYKRFKSHSGTYEINISDNYYKIKDNTTIPAEIMIKHKDIDYPLSTIKIIHKDLIPEDQINNFEEADIDYVRKVIDSQLNPYLDKAIPNVIYWEYDKKYLLPSEITYDELIKNDDPYTNSAPLYNIFLLSNRLIINDEEELIEKINAWKLDSSLRRRDSHILTEDINKYIKGIWNDYDQLLNIDLEEAQITIHVTDPSSSISNYYDMESRSQGFKTFISFILTIAAEAESKIISNFILVLDEPETHLHPSGVRFMKEELIKLSSNNYVFYATHSIFMIDRSNLKRNIIVKKDREITRLLPVERNNIIQESVIYEALGTSVDEFSISNKNVVFEGTTDLYLFNSFIEHCVPKRENTFSDYELLDGGGTKNISTFFRSKIIPRDSEWILILDYDSPGRNLKSELEKHDSNLRNNLKFHYYSTITDQELEDILPQDIIISTISEVISSFGPIEIQQKFTIIGNRTISSLINEFKNINKIDKQHNFEELFKNVLHQKLTLIIEQISKESNFDKRRDLFKKLLPKYYEFITPLLLNYGITIDYN
ncbi:MAG: AAA family ATPase [Spirochaetes bacterium]|nr:AAA family ATPase [Spirochaetota bacterium]